MDKYLEELRGNRAYQAGAILKKHLHHAGIDLGGLRKNLLRDLSLLQNRSRGQIFELMAEVMIAEQLGLKDFVRQSVFKTPFGARRIDLWVPDQGLAIEIKSGYARSRKYVRDQIRKDKYILENEPRVKQVAWVCFRGATKPLAALLEANGIEYLDIGYDK